MHASAFINVFLVKLGATLYMLYNHSGLVLFAHSNLFFIVWFSVTFEYTLLETRRWSLTLGRLPAKDVLPVETMQNKARQRGRRKS